MISRAAAFRAIITVAILVTASVSRSAPQPGDSAPPVIPAAASSGGTASGTIAETRPGTPNEPGEAPQGLARIGEQAPPIRFGAPLMAEGRIPVRLSATHAEASVSGNAPASRLRTLTTPRAPAAVTGGGVRFSSWQRVIASSYGIGDGFLRKKMACGGPLTARDLTVAHRTLPCGARVQFRFRGRTVTALVTDRGPYVAGRTFDLGPAVARALHFDGLDVIEWRRA